MAKDHAADAESQGPRTRYYGSEGQPYSGDADFTAWQRRRYSINRWDLIAAGSLPLAFVGGGVTFNLTGSRAAALFVFFSSMAIGLWASVRKWLWAHTGS